MTEGDRKHHGHTTGPAPKDAPAEPTHAERARTLLVRTGEGTLATLSRRHAGFPFASLMPFALDALGRPVVLVSALAVHTQNLQGDPRASLLVMEPDFGSGNPLGMARVTLLGRMHEVAGEGPEDGTEMKAVRESYLARHREARYWVDYPDFGFRRMEVEAVYYVGGFGVMGWVSSDEYRQAEPDPLRDAARGILEHMNEDHPDALLLLARSAGVEGAKEARMTAVDRLGYHLRIRTEEGVQGIRIGFPVEARGPERVRELLVAQVKQARGH